ncbi:unnamed protein product [Cladocopium goreaui]|uniref:Uncharacterized protein n=1 Tax=Cladocopium goreaui TaxID=2562237 RepID=A0A9P1FKR9_9DINO|nr:unnamed protein product [Cladocopium goreaui]
MVTRQTKESDQQGIATSNAVEECWEGASEATSSSLRSFVKSFANPQHSTALAIALSLIAVGIQAWEEEVILSRALFLIGLLVIPAAIGRPLPPAEVFELVEIDEVSRTQPKVAEVPPAQAMDSTPYLV